MRHRFVVLALVALAATGCRPSPARVPPTTTARLTSSVLGTSTNDEAVMRTTTARCERELACNKIGEGRTYEDQPTCLERIGALMEEEAGKASCPSGVDPFALSACLLDIQEIPCGGELERSTNVPACTKASLCVR